MAQRVPQTAHSCIHCEDIILPGDTEELQVSWLPNWEDPRKSDFDSCTLNRLHISLSDLRLKADALCELAMYLQGHIENTLYNWPDPNAVQLFTRWSALSEHMEIVALAYLPAQYKQTAALMDLDMSQYYVSATQHGYDEIILCELTVEAEVDCQNKVPFRRPICLDPLSTSTITAVRKWLNHCEDQRDNSHKICSLGEDSFMPTRVIEIGAASPAQLQLRIVRGKGMEKHDMSKYVALSYCWGGPQKAQLTIANYRSYEANIPWISLPATLKDAATAAYSLGFRYLWIDSMCIIQDSEEDKANEIGQMTKIYTHAALTIMAKRGNRATDGFLHQRSLPSGTSLVQYRTGHGPTRWTTLTFKSAYVEENNITLNTRGWVMQEYVLSRRFLIVGTWMTEWHCRSKRYVHSDGWKIERYGGERSSTGDPFTYSPRWDDHDGLFESADASSVHTIHLIDAVMFFSANPACQHRPPRQELIQREWNALVKAYSPRSLTVSKDRVLAIAGIAERFAALIPQRYIAGMWESMMPEALLWHRDSSALSERPTSYQGPSWSWVSITDDVYYLECTECLCRVLSIDYSLERADALYGALTSATLHIEGPAWTVEWRYSRDPQTQRFGTSEFRWHQRSSSEEESVDAQVELILDAREMDTGWKEVILLANMISTWRARRTVRGMALIWKEKMKVNNEYRDVFRRIGEFAVRSYDLISPLPQVESWPTRSYFIV